CLNGVYLVFGWLPAMLSAQGLDVGSASTGLAAYNLGGVLGVLIWGGLVAIAGSRPPMLAGAPGRAGVGAAARSVPLRPSGSHTLLIAGIGLQGLFANAVQTTLYALSAHVYPTRIRATGVAAAAAVGRGGAMLSSFTGAALIQAGSGVYLTILAVCMVCAA